MVVSFRVVSFAFFLFKFADRCLDKDNSLLLEKIKLKKDFAQKKLAMMVSFEIIFFFLIGH
jgi:hypothetical protein